MSVARFPALQISSSPLAEGRELKCNRKVGRAVPVTPSPLAEGRELKC